MNAFYATGFKSFLWLAALCLTSVSLLGCGDGRGTVTGQVTLDGKPLAGGSDVSGTVLFHPAGGAGRPATGSLDERGRYSLAAGSQASIEPGSYIVTVSATQIIPAATPGEAPSGRPLTSSRYSDPRQSEWKVEVKPGNNQFDFQMKSDG